MEVQLARLTAIVEAGGHLAAERHKESTERLVRIERQVRETNGRVTTLEAWQAAMKDERADGDNKPINVFLKWGGVFAAGFGAALLILGLLK